MSWSGTRPRSAKYNYAHAKTRAQHMQALEQQGVGRCAERICLARSRRITAAMGRQLHLCHDRDTGQVLGLGHARCNLVEAARYARAKQDRQARSTTIDDATRLDWG